MSGRGSVLVIGSGAAGSGAARKLAGAGWDVTVAERGKVGGTCLWSGCIPKKALYNTARSMRDVLASEQFGIECGEPSVDWQSVLAWKWHAQETYAGDQEGIMVDRGIRLLKAGARFTSPKQVEVGGEMLTPDHVVLATGSAPVLPPIEGIDLADTSEQALHYTEPPESLLIVGGGYIGMEFAGIYASFGTKVTVVEAGDRVLPASDADAAAVVARHLAHLGVEFFYGCRIERLSGETGNISGTFKETASGETHTDQYHRVLMATGRRPVYDGLELETAGIELDNRGRLVIDKYLRTTNPNIWAAGDAAGGMMQTPVAHYEGTVVAESIDSGEPREPVCTTVPTTVFTVPQLAQVGLTEDQAKAANIPYRISQTTFEYLGAAVIEDDRDGLVKYLFAKEDDRLLGAHIAGPAADAMIYAAALGIKIGATSEDLRCVSGIHPGYSEALNWAAG